MAMWRHVVAVGAGVAMLGYLVFEFAMAWRGHVLPQGMDLLKVAGAALGGPLITMFGVYAMTSRDTWKTPEPTRGVVYNGKEYASMDEAMGKRKPVDSWAASSGILVVGLGLFAYAVAMLHAAT